MHADRLTDSICHHAEGPYWSDSWGGLRWVDMLAGDIMQLEAAGALTQLGGARTAHRITTPSPVVACVRPALGGGAVLALEKGFALEDADGSITPLPPLWEQDIRMNEGAIAPDGSFLCGSMAYDQRPGAAAMWRLLPDGTTTELFGDLTISNGLAFTADGARAFYVDTPTGRVDQFDWSDDEGLIGRRPFADLTDQDGHPDGLTLDADGRVWVAMNGGGQVLGLDERGAVTAQISVGARQVTACTFGGQDRSTLFITTSRENLAEGEDPQAGSLFAARPGARGPESERLFGV
ncbi:MAG: SMP-30/gluconolactonase/LRE family protein [Brachybacterium sp.]|uniref:SMP-30/gluconolactonase/LRE family protein n=1 Tax=Brachybacterium sp. TaxID=1891286 RepID=UPI00264A39EC|nr:SMP-30/gluconolactonase/LRE family protein [Brachybacterium sp.]MDN5688346.1 SMP-30/gluconolactonase/LRE family protein [Brachybacterium sp.]